MKVSAFMILAATVLTATAKDTVRSVMELMVQKQVDAIIVVDDSAESAVPKPIGIITKSDVVHAYLHQVGLEEPCAKIMSRDLETCKSVMDRDQVARILEQNKLRHIVVVDDNKNFQGLVTSWDIIAECAKDGRAWPRIRSEDGKFHNPFPSPASPVPPIPASPVTLKPIIVHHMHYSEQYEDYVDVLGFL
jgi:CBS domain-containing protein